MKSKLFRNLLVVSTLSLTCLLASCSDVKAEPGNIDNPIVDILDKDDNYFRNTIETIYNDLVDTGTTNSTVFDELVQNIAKLEVVGNFASEEKIMDICHEIMLDEVKGGSYSTNRLFDEEKYVVTLKASNPGVNFDATNGYNKNYLIKPEDTFEDVFKVDYTEYIEKNVKPNVLKKLLTSKYLCENSVSSLSRASARDVQYIKLTNFTNKKGEVNKLINEWLGSYISNPTETIDLDELQSIYKGIIQDTEGLEGEELTKAQRINDYIDRYYTLADEIEEEIAGIVEKNENGTLKKENGHYVMKKTDDLTSKEQDNENKYTGSGKYTIEWGEELALRELAQKDFTGENIYTKSVGISDLTSDITDRLFSASIASYVSSSEKGGVNFLTPKTSLNGSSLGKYYFYDSTSDAYYIVVVKKYFTSSVVNKLISDNTTEDGTITYRDPLIDIGYDLADSSTNQRQALIHYLQKYDVASNIHDQDFYDYIVDNYSEIIKK